jgi:TPR repeat protein
VIYLNGQGVTKDYKEAAKWFRLAAHQGNVHAHYNLGWLYWQGKGVIKNYVLSHMWFNIAAINGDQEAEKARAALEIQIKSKEKIARAKKLARECIENHYKNCRL